MGKGFRGLGFKKKKAAVTLDLGYEKSYQIDTPETCGLLIGKLHGIGARSEQQDSFGISELKAEVIEKKGVFAILADGMGGLSGGERASMATVISCLHYFDTQDIEESIPNALVEMARNANSEVREVLGISGGTSGSTLAAVIVREEALFWMTVGDSRIFLYRDYVLTQLNRDHNYAARLREKVEAGEITQQEAMEDPQKDALTSYIGISHLKEIDCNQEALMLASGDRILLLSDGVYNSVTEEEIVESMKLPLSRGMMNLGMQVEEKRKKNQDNYTAIVLEIK